MRTPSPWVSLRSGEHKTKKSDVRALEYPQQSNVTISLAGIAYTAAMMEPEAANSTNTFSYQKIFSDDDFIAAGVLVLPVDGEKPMKGTKDNTYVRILLYPFSDVAMTHKLGILRCFSAIWEP
jgi:hypothetical protein